MADDAARSDLFEQLAAAFDANESAGRDLEARLVMQARAGDRDAFGALYRQHVSTIYRYCWLHTGGPRETVEDLTSTVFLRAWQSIGRYEERGRPLAFRRTTDPYAILVSEAMAQQTQAALWAERQGQARLAAVRNRRGVGRLDQTAGGGVDGGGVFALIIFSNFSIFSSKDFMVFTS